MGAEVDERLADMTDPPNADLALRRPKWPPFDRP